MSSDLRQRWNSYLELWEPVVYAAWAFRVTAVNAIKTQGFSALASCTSWRDEAFALWYRTLVVHFSRYEGTTAVPQLAASASGTILELGPGLGSQVARFDPSKVEHIYGVESNKFFIPDLKAKVTESGLDGKYTLVPFGVQDTDVLAKHGITPGSIDTIVSFQVLCSVPRPVAVAKELYGLLKPGGKLIFWEHHGSHDWVTRIAQSVWNIIWPYAIGGCHLNRDMLEILKDAGEWENADAIETDEQPSAMLPRVWGVLVKPL